MNEKIDWDKVTIEGAESQETEGPREVVSDTSEKTSSLESSQVALRGNLERMEGKLNAIDALPQAVVDSPEGKECSQSFSKDIFEKISGFGSKMKEKITSGFAKFDDPGRVMAVLGSTSLVAIVGPVLLQMARSKWPEVGAMLDASPDFIQHFAHLDLFSSIVDKFSPGQQGWVWDTSNYDGMNLLSDIASGKIDFASLDSEKLNLLQDTLPADSLRAIEHFAQHPQMIGGRFVDAQSQAGIDAGLSAMVPAFGNAGIIGAAASGFGVALNKLGTIARNDISRANN